MKKIFPFLSLFVVVLCLAGCGKPRLDLNVASQPNVNPDNSSRPSPVLVKTYELRNDLAFKQADFQSLFERPVPTLGADLIAADELVFIPGEARKVAYKPTPGTRFLGVVAGFRQMERAQWRIIKAIDPEEKNIVALELNDTSILIIPDKQAKDWDPEEAVKGFQQQMTRPAPQPGPGQAQPGQADARTMPPVQQSGGAQPASSADGTLDRFGRAVTTVRKNTPVDDIAKQGAQQGLNRALPPSAPVQSTPAVRTMSPF